MVKQIVAGENVYTKIETMKSHEVPKSDMPGREHCYASDHLCAFQSKMHSNGYEGAEIVESIYGFGVRYDSGLNGFSILYSAKGTTGNYETALEWAREWQQRDPHKRYVIFRGDTTQRTLYPYMASTKMQANI